VFKVLDSGTAGEQDHLLVGRPEVNVLLTVIDGATVRLALLYLKLPHSLNTRFPICILRGGRGKGGREERGKRISMQPLLHNDVGVLLHSTQT